MNDHSYSQEHIQKAEKRIKSQLEQNGVDPADIKLEVKRQGIDTLTAQTSFSLDCHVDTKEIKGKSTSGTVVSNGSMQKEIDTFLKDFAEKDSVETLAKDKIKALPLSGFGAESQTINLDTVKKVFTEHITCKNCRGKGQAQCPKCNGQTRVQCPKCFGRGEKQCHLCHGHGQLQEGNQRKQCYECWGRGEVMCINCQGRKQIPCAHCHMKGSIQCNTCNGQGTNTLQATITPFLKTTVAINTGELEDDPKRMVGKIGGISLAQGGHIDIKSVKPPVQEEEEERAYYEDAPVDISKNTVFYEAKLPWAVTEIKIDGRPHDINFIGKKGAVAQSGRFMEQITEPYLQKLNQSLLGHNNAQAAIKEACNLRVSRETFSMLGKSKPKKTMQQIYKTYPLGWSKSYIQTFVTTAYKTLKKATRRPRYIGLGIGLALAAVINYIWFLIDIDLNIPSNYEILLDGLPFVVSLFVTVLAIKVIGFFIYQSLMKDLGIKSKAAPPMGKAGLYALIGNLVISGGFIAGRYLNLY